MISEETIISDHPKGRKGKHHQTTTEMEHKESKLDTVPEKSIITSKIQDQELIEETYPQILSPILP